MTDIPVVWSLGGFGFCISGPFLRIIAFRNQKASMPTPQSNMEAGGGSPLQRGPQTAAIPLGPWETGVQSPCRWPIQSIIGLTVGSSSSDGATASLLPSSFIHCSLAWPLAPFRTNLSSDFPVRIWKGLSCPVFPRALLAIPSIPTALVSWAGLKMMRLLWHPPPYLSLPSEPSPICRSSSWNVRLRAALCPLGWASHPAELSWMPQPMRLTCHHSLSASGSKIKPPKCITCVTAQPPFLCPVESLLQNHFSGSEWSVPHHCAHPASPSHVQKILQNPLCLISRGRSKAEPCTCLPLVALTWLFSFFLLKFLMSVRAPWGHWGASRRWYLGPWCRLPFQTQQLPGACVSILYFCVRFHLNQGFNSSESRKLSSLLPRLLWLMVVAPDTLTLPLNVVSLQIWKASLLYLSLFHW